MIFFLSAINPDDHLSVLKKLANLLKPGGCILLRDYGAYDMVMMRFIRKQKGRIIDLEKRLFKRGDDIMSSFFTLEQMAALMKSIGLEVVKQEYCT
eukprot:CAMPEP_0170554322 /NCGR_PEP_ID=MMETSP0211-20121228/12172_1 /TAXON_ID=311385 /ORGANISM="Pseudokeronopsis sp., Strain OXSARD2" /LENGTH=95 /DNA_ID=CAMNT_0010863277 /DNA_START=486 /DNA_END=770 /DNA_ORIENTATION=+